LLHALVMSLSHVALAETEPASPPSQSDERDRDQFGPWVPDYARLQTGGFVGTVAAGLGYAAFDDILNVSLLYGYTPDEGGDVHALELSAAARPFELGFDRVRVVPLYLGIGLLGTWGRRYYLDLPDQYPDDYYPPNALQPVLFVGSELDWVSNGKVVERQGLYFELKTLTTFVARYARNPEVVDFEDIVAGCVGYRIAF
jgi:hypothetical protein